MSSKISIMVPATANNAGVIVVGPTNSASAVATNTNGSMSVSGVYPPFNLFEGVHTTVGWSAFQWPVLASGVVVESIKPVLIYKGTLVTDNDALAFFAPGGFPSLPSSGTWVGGSIGTTEADLEAFSINFSFQATTQLSNYVGSFVVSDVALQVILSVPGQASVSVHIDNTRPLGS